MYVSTKIHVAKIVQTEGRTSSLLECYAEVQPILLQRYTKKRIRIWCLTIITAQTPIRLKRVSNFATSYNNNNITNEKET